MSSSFIGKVVDNYRIIENLGIGGMGVVFKAIHIKLDKLFALKMIAPGLAMNENFIKRFQTEANYFGTKSFGYVRRLSVEKQ